MSELWGEFAKSVKEEGNTRELACAVYELFEGQKVSTAMEVMALVKDWIRDEACIPNKDNAQNSAYGGMNDGKF